MQGQDGFFEGFLKKLNQPGDGFDRNRIQSGLLGSYILANPRLHLKIIGKITDEA